MAEMGQMETWGQNLKLDVITIIITMVQEVAVLEDKEEMVVEAQVRQLEDVVVRAEMVEKAVQAVQGNQKRLNIRFVQMGIVGMLGLLVLMGLIWVMFI